MCLINILKLTSKIFVKKTKQALIKRKARLVMNQTKVNNGAVVSQIKNEGIAMDKTINKIKDAVFNELRRVPGKIVKIDPTIYENGPENTMKPYDYSSRNSVYGLTEYSSSDGKTKHTVPFAVEIAYDGAEPNILVRLKALYCWNANDRNDVNYWGKVILTNYGEQGLLDLNKRPAWMKDSDELEFQPAVDPKKVSEFLAGNGEESMHYSNGATAKFSDDPEFQSFLDDFYQVDQIEVPNPRPTKLNQEKLDLLIKQQNQVEPKRSYDANADPMAALIANAKAAMKKWHKQYGFSKGYLDLGSLHTAAFYFYIDDPELPIANNFDYLQKQKNAKLTEYQVLTFTYLAKNKVMFKVINRQTKDGQNHDQHYARYEAAKSDQVLEQQIVQLPGSASQLENQAGALPTDEENIVDLSK